MWSTPTPVPSLAESVTVTGVLYQPRTSVPVSDELVAGAELSSMKKAVCVCSIAPVTVSSVKYSSVYRPSAPSFAFRCTVQDAVPVPIPQTESLGAAVPERQKRS